MKSVVVVLSGIGALIALFLLLNKGDKTVAIIKAIAENSTAGIKVLQGR